MTGIRANFLVAIREDSLSQLDRFKDSIQDLYGNTSRLEPLDRAARAAIVRPSSSSTACWLSGHCRWPWNLNLSTRSWIR